MLVATALACAVAGCADGTDAADGAAPAADPFARQPDEATGLTDVSDDLLAVLEQGRLAGACDRYLSGDADDRPARLLCGKELFFHGAFDAVGPPRLLFTLFLDHFADLVGPGYAAYGMIADPFDPDGMPLGLAPAAPLGDLPTVAYTCASCHFARLQDGRYAVGAPNHRYDYGKQLLLMMTVLPLIGGGTASDHDPVAIAAVQPFLDRLDADPGLRITLGLELLPLLGGGGTALPALGVEQEGHYAGWQSGVLDAFAPPLPVDDGVHITTKIHALWGIPRVAEAQAAGAPHEMLGWSGGGHDLDRFLQVFLLTSGAPADRWPPERMAPLADYLYSLRPPPPPPSGSSDAIARGGALFRDACLGCHGGPRGMGTAIVAPADLGVDPAIARMMDPELDGSFCCGYQPSPDEAPTHGVKAPRLVGLWAMERFLHNGALDSLEQLLCLAPRPAPSASPDSAAGHEAGCELPAADRQALIDFLRSH
jgi:mono/diheme cytochrome c family protein